MSLNLILTLSLIQGITEFLPISSSGHLVIIPFFMELPYQGKLFDISVHFGSLFAVIFYLRSDISKIVQDLFSKNRSLSFGYKITKNIILASLPLIIFGYIVNSYDFKFLQLIEIVGWTTLIFGIILGISDKVKIKTYNLPKTKESIIIGIFQSLALLPGVSRSGIVITMARFLGHNRSSSSKFALFLSIPAILGATTLKLLSMISNENIHFSNEIFLGLILSFIFAFLTIKIFMNYIEKASLQIFVFYRILLGIFILYLVYLNN